MGIVGALLIANWSRGLLRQTGRILLDRQGSPEMLEAIRGPIESDGRARVVDLHVWSIGPGIHAAEIVLVAEDPRDPGEYKAQLPDDLGLVHVAVEVHPSDGSER
jgi:Co/Zn/Cd efflux system component